MKLFLSVICLMNLSMKESFNSSMVYRALGSDSLEQVLDVLQVLDSEKQTATIRAYRGSLKAKEAAFVKGIKNKFDTFNEGVSLLDSEISANPNNVEFRFLRLSIQERCPAILHYSGNIEEDSQMIIKNYKKMSPGLRREVDLYLKSSTVISSSDFSQ